MDEHYGAIVRHVQDQPDAATGAAEATAVGKRLQELVIQVAQLRSAYARALRTEGWSMEEIAEVCGVTRARMEQIVNR